ncbi:hypothetical protein BD289DRAFT_263385 [Coniella lustricola]|uniref:Uncharacterized protein n=1 Tax=Coniella lustricola TaxID=2025994 RepID=A0A2T3A7K6_9PEZI|nr:hypothetical protein BD289DRAFT_263385 [Coniella lustricola]
MSDRLLPRRMVKLEQRLSSKPSKQQPRVTICPSRKSSRTAYSQICLFGNTLLFDSGSRWSMRGLNRAYVSMKRSRSILSSETFFKVDMAKTVARTEKWSACISSTAAVASSDRTRMVRHNLHKHITNIADGVLLFPVRKGTSRKIAFSPSISFLVFKLDEVQ